MNTVACFGFVSKGKSLRQRGAVLIVSLLMLLVMTLIGITGVQVTSLEEKMAGNTRDRNLAFQSAEAALRAAEGSIATAVKDSVLSAFEAQFTGHPYYPIGSTIPTDMLSGESESWGSAVSYTGTLEGVAEAPKYIIERLTYTKPDVSAPMRHYFRITARGKGGTANAIVVLQSIYEVQEP